MQRRKLLQQLPAWLTAPAVAQAPADAKLLVVLTSVSKASLGEVETLTRQELAGRGWHEGDNLRLEFRYADASLRRPGGQVTIGLTQQFEYIRPKTYELARQVAPSALRLPSGSQHQAHAQAGGLCSYGLDLRAMWHRAVQMADQVLRGHPVGEIPFEQPTRIILPLTRSTAAAIGLAFPREMLLRADEVIG